MPIQAKQQAAAVAEDDAPHELTSTAGASFHIRPNNFIVSTGLRFCCCLISGRFAMVKRTYADKGGFGASCVFFKRRCNVIRQSSRELSKSDASSISRYTDNQPVA